MRTPVYCIVGVEPSKDHKSIFFLEMASLSLTVADVRELDVGGGAVHGLLDHDCCV